MTASSVAKETIRELAEAPDGRRVLDLEKRLGEPVEVVRTLNRLQQAGLVHIQLEPGSLELTVRPAPGRSEALRGLLRKVQ
jgi:hypothetical protein